MNAMDMKVEDMAELSPAPAARPARGSRRTGWGLTLILLVSALAIAGAMRHTSTTFDEIGFVGDAARGYATGEFVMVPDQPPVMEYLYGALVAIAGPHLPAERPGKWVRSTHHSYAQELFWRSGNDPERLAFTARLVAAAIALLLVGLTYAFTRRRAGDPAALLAAALVAFLPDVLAHGGIAYNDVGTALSILGAVVVIDWAVRKLSARRAAAAAAAAAVALGVKFTAVALVPIAGALLAAEVLARSQHPRALLRDALRALPVALAAFYLTLVLVYRGDFPLEDFRARWNFNITHAQSGHAGARAFLLGRYSETGFWYFFPVAFLFKTPAALHALVLLAGAGLWLTRRPAGWRERLASPLRAPLVALLVLGAFLVTAKLNIGFRHALPALPFLCVLVAAGVARLWGAVGRGLRTAVVALVLWYVGSALSFYPHFLAYTSEYAPSRDRGHEVLVDSSFDWGQELLHLREFMREHDIPRVYLSYFGSALPDGYGIDYEPLPSFFPLIPWEGREQEPRPEWAVISATNLAGVYFEGDPFARFRGVRPDYVLGHALFVYRLQP